MYAAAWRAGPSACTDCLYVVSDTDGTVFDVSGSAPALTMTVNWVDLNTDACGSVCNDGISAGVAHTITSTGAATPPTWVSNWITQDADNKFDTKPSTKLETKNSAAETEDNVTIVENTSTDLCKQLWQTSTESVACVEVVGSVTRPFAATDADADIKLDYIPFEVTAVIELTDVEVNTKNQFDTVQVDYAYFKEPEEGALSGITMSALAILAAGISLIF